MSRISQELASTIAHKVAQPLEDKKVALQKQIADIFKQEYLATIPVEVMEVYKKYPKFVDTRSSCYINGQGIVGNYFLNSSAIEESLPDAGDMYYFTLSNEAALKCAELINQVAATINKYNQVKEEIKNTLLTLKTFKKIREVLPEVAQYLPEQNVTMSLAVNFDKVHDTIKCLVSPEKACVDTL